MPAGFNRAASLLTPNPSLLRKEGSFLFSFLNPLCEAERVDKRSDVGVSQLTERQYLKYPRSLQLRRGFYHRKPAYLRGKINCCRWCRFPIGAHPHIRSADPFHKQRLRIVF
jgi:hypothetical protein